MQEKKREQLFRITYFLLYLALSFSFCLLMPFLISLGYTATERGVMLAFGAIAGMVVQFWIGYLCDKNKTIKKYTHYVYFLYALITVLLYLTDFHNLAVHILLVGTMQIFFRVSIGLVDSWVLESSEECKENYGSMRAFGSLGWVVGSYLVSLMVTEVGYKPIGIVFIVVIFLTYMVGRSVADAQKQENAKIDLKDVHLLFENKLYILLILILFGVFMMQSSLDVTIVDKLAVLNASAKQVSYYWMVTGIVEIPLFFVGNKLAKKYGYTDLLIVSVAIYGLRFVLYGLATTITQVMLTSLLQFLSFPIIQVVSKQMVDQQSPGNLKSSGQLIGLALYNCTSALCAPLMAGYLEDTFNIDVACFAIGTFAIFSILLAFVYRRSDKKSKR